MTSGVTVDLQLKPCILIGAGGHARVVQELATLCGASIVGVCDPKFESSAEQRWNGLKVLGGDACLAEVDPKTTLLLNGLGMMPGNAIRKALYSRLSGMGFHFPALVHPFAWVSSGASINDGAQIMAGAVVQPGARVGDNSIINTRSSIDHDTHVGAHCHIAPGVTLCGDVCIGDSSFIGAGATVIQGVVAAPESIIKAGSLTTRDVV